MVGTTLTDLDDPVPLFHDQKDAGGRLADLLLHHRGHDVLVLAISRGGVPVASELARRLDADVDVVGPFELGLLPPPPIGSDAENNLWLRDQAIRREFGIPIPAPSSVRDPGQEEARRRLERWRDGAPPRHVRGRTVVLVDGGLADAEPLQTVVRQIRRRHPARLVLAAPVAALSACEALASEVDDLVCLAIPAVFATVEGYYRHYEPVEDAQIRQLLAAAHGRRRQRQSAG